MDIDDILHDLAFVSELPVAAIEAAREKREQLIPLFLDAIDRAIEDGAEAAEERSPIFFIFHMLAEFRCTAAYPKLARLLRIDPGRLANLLGDAITETAKRV